MAPNLNCSYPCTPVLKLCKTSQLPSDLPPARTDSSLCWEDCEEVSLSSFSHLRRTQTSDVPFLGHPHHKHLQENPSSGVTSSGVTSLSPRYPNNGRDERTIHSSHLIILFGGVAFFMPFPVVEISYFQGISAWVFSVSGA